MHKRSEDNVVVSMVVAPLSYDFAWQVESFLLEIFEYGDYSFRAALRGEYSETLSCVFFLAKDGERIVGTAGCLYAVNDPRIAILGPVGVAKDFRRNGLGTRLVDHVISYLDERGSNVIYLGVSHSNPAVNLYHRLGFTRYHGIVMRRMLNGDSALEDYYKEHGQEVNIRPAAWGDFPKIQALACYPCRIKTFDLAGGIFSSRYAEPMRFLSVFPSIMKSITKQGGVINVLTAGPEESIVGIAHIIKYRPKPQQHMGILDFYIHDAFLDRVPKLLSKTIQDAGSLSVTNVSFSCVSTDQIKSNIMARLGARRVSVLPHSVYLSGSIEDILTYYL